MTLVTYQSKAVMDILLKNQVYRAKPSISYKREYGALIKMLNLDCKCPIFAVVKGRKQNTAGKISSSVKLTLNVPDDKIKYTEFGVWADFLYASQFTKPHDFSRLQAGCEELTQRRYAEIIENLKDPQDQSQYECPQAILEEIRPEWLVKHSVVHNTKSFLNFAEKIANKFRK